MISASILHRWDRISLGLCGSRPKTFLESNYISPPSPLPPSSFLWTIAIPAKQPLHFYFRLPWCILPKALNQLPALLDLKLQWLQVAPRIKSSLYLGLQSLLWADPYLTLWPMIPSVYSPGFRHPDFPSIASNTRHIFLPLGAVLSLRGSLCLGCCPPCPHMDGSILTLASIEGFSDHVV